MRGSRFDQIDRGQKTEDRGQRIEVGSQRTGDSMQPFDKLRTGGQLAACRKQSQLQNPPVGASFACDLNGFNDFNEFNDFP